MYLVWISFKKCGVIQIYIILNAEPEKKVRRRYSNFYPDPDDVEDVDDKHEELEDFESDEGEDDDV